MHETIDFPNLGIHLKNVGKTISVFHFDVAYYGVIIGLGILAGLLIAMHVGKEDRTESGRLYRSGYLWGYLWYYRSQSILCCIFLGYV